MTSLEPLRGRSYQEDLEWRMVYQRKMLGLTSQQVACNLSVHSSTVWRTIKRFEEDGSVDDRKNEGPHKLTELEEFAIMEIVLEKPSVYLREIVSHIQDRTTVHESTMHLSLPIKTEQFLPQKAKQHCKAAKCTTEGRIPN